MKYLPTQGSSVDLVDVNAARYPRYSSCLETHLPICCMDLGD